MPMLRRKFCSGYGCTRLGCRRGRSEPWRMTQRYGTSNQASERYSTRTAGSWGALVDRRRGGPQRGDSARYSEHGNSWHTEGRRHPRTARPSHLIEEFGCDQFPGFATSDRGAPGGRYRTQTALGTLVGIPQVENRFHGKALAVSCRVDRVAEGARKLEQEGPSGFGALSAHKIEGPFGVLFFTPVAEEWSISKADGEPADFGHDMERHQEVENDGKYAGLADERSGLLSLATSTFPS